MRTNSILPEPARIEELLTVTGTTIRPGGLTLTERAVEFCRLGPGSRVADIGCGVGGSLEYLQRVYDIAAFGMDPSATLLDASRRRSPEANLIQGVAERLPFRNSCLNGIFCECVVSLVADVDSALLEFWRVLKPGGYLVISDIYARCPTSEQNFACTFGHSAMRTKEETTDLLLRYRFTSLVWEDHTDKLKELAVQLIFTYGSVDGFKKVLCSDDRQRNGRLLHQPARPGYFLLIAQKRRFTYG